MSSTQLPPLAKGLLTTLVLPAGARPDLAYLFGTGPTTFAAGTVFSYAVAGGRYELIQTVFATLATSAAVANRQVILVFADAASNTILECATGVVQTANSTVNYTFATNVASGGSVAGGSVTTPIPLVVLTAGGVVRLRGGIQAGDQFSAGLVSSLVVPSGPADFAERGTPTPRVPTPVLV